MLNGSIYVINDPSLIAAAMRNRSLSLEPFNLEFAVSTMGMTKHHLDLFSAPGRMGEILNIHHNALSPANLVPMNTTALAHIADKLNAIPAGGHGLEIPDVHEWLRELASMATMKALFGRNNPYTYDDVKNVL